MLRPYEPGKIPVVMVHGLASTPLAWIPMLNELLGNPAIRRCTSYIVLSTQIAHRTGPLVQAAARQ